MLISFDDIMARYKNMIKGIIHLGAHEAEELEFYTKYDLPCVWVEGNPQLISKVQSRIESLVNHVCYQALLWSHSGESKQFNVTNNGQSSSMLPMAEHSSYYPDIKNIQTLTLTTTTVKDLIDSNHIDIQTYNFANLDLQGVEYEVLKGFGDYLANIDFVYSEVNVGELYKGVCHLPEFNSFMESQGFVLTMLKLVPQQWGDALYVRKNLCSSESVIDSYTLNSEFARCQSQKPVISSPSSHIQSVASKSIPNRPGGSLSFQQLQKRHHLLRKQLNKRK